MDSFHYTFAALRGVQAGREFFVAMCPLRLLPRLLQFDSQELPPELRAQRVLNRGRIPAITRYIVEHPGDYVFSAITASIDGPVRFEPYEPGGVRSTISQLTVPLSARFIVNDGQHRRAAIEEALGERPDLGDETIAVVFFLDAGLKRSQQIFADLNTHTVRASASIGILYDYRSPLAQVDLCARREVIDEAIRQAHATLAHTSSQLAHVRGKHESVERQLAAEGGGIVAQRDRLKQRVETLREAIRGHERAIAEQASGLLPFAAIPQFAGDLRERLERDERVERYLQVSNDEAQVDAAIALVARRVRALRALAAGG